MAIGQIKEFTDLEAWKEAHKLVLLVYMTTKKFPPDELFGLVSQLRRASISITSNIAEGFSRYHYADRIRFYYMARGSLSEVQNQLLASRDLQYIPNLEYENFKKNIDHVFALLNGLIQSTNQRSQS